MKTKDIISLIVLVAIIGIAGWRWSHALYTEKQTAIKMDTVVTITATSHSKDVNKVITQAMDLIGQYDERFSYTNPKSEVWAINHSSQDSLTISPDLYAMLKVGADLYAKSDSLYDLTIGPLSEAWGFIQKGDTTGFKCEVPSPDSIRTAKARIGFNRIQFGETWIKRPHGVTLNLGSIAKGYIVDHTVEFLQKNGVLSGWVQAGGDIHYFGKMPYQRTGIQNPRGESGDVVGILRLRDITVDTSGDYERFFMVGDKRYHHILNPKTGYPADTAVSVTVLAPDGTLADALSTAIFLLGPDKGLKLAESFPGVETVIYSMENGTLTPHYTPGMIHYLEKK